MDDCDGLENRSGCKLTGGSNPSPSARRFSISESFAKLNKPVEAPSGEVPEWTIGAAC